MVINIKNVIGLIGLVFLLFYGRSILTSAKAINPLCLLAPLHATSDPGRLVVLGFLLVAVLLALRYAIRR